jgi:hypothetical protein
LLAFRRSVALRPALAPPLHQPGALVAPVSQLYPGVAELEAGRLPPLLVKMPHVEVVVALLVEPQHLFHALERPPAGTGLPPATGRGLLDAGLGRVL